MVKSMSSVKSSYTVPPPCNHLASYKIKNGLSGYNSLKESLKFVAPNRSPTIWRPQWKNPTCKHPHPPHQQRLYLCLTCDSLSCLDHTLLHARSSLGHEIAVDIERAELYCASCRDQVYDPDFDRAVMCKYLKDVSKNGYIEGSIADRSSSSKRRRLVSLVDLDLSISKQMICSVDQRAKSCYPLGLRGLSNLGNTCFMNSVLQVLLHAPPFRNYFLNDRHKHESCRKNSSDRFCLLCDIDVIFSAVFSGDRSPFSPAQFLYSWWQHSANLASYEQQDAHEFLISLLDGIHEKEGKTKDISKDGRDCQCIAHRVFSGLLRSDVTCMTCGFTSTTYDPCVDISLHMDTNNLHPSKTNLPTGSSSLSTSSTSLIGCLDLFTKPEKLGSDQKLHCQNCQEKKASMKQLSIRRLPLVLCLHIKRFEHSLIKKTSRKIDWHLQFPFSLDMTPYLSSSIVQKRYGNRIFSFEGDESDISSSEFEIFAVITHSGMLESGHYVTFVRLRNSWYKCDDAWVTEVDEKVVRASQCYMLFYVQKTLYCKANEELSCLPISLQRDELLHVVDCC